SPRFATIRSKRASSSSMRAGGSLANTPCCRLASEKMLRATRTAVSPAATWSKVTRMSSTSSSRAISSASLIARARATGVGRRLSGRRPSPVPPTTTSVPPPSNISRTSPRSRNTERAAPLCAASGSLPRAACSSAATSDNSRRRSAESAPNGASTASCSGVARKAGVLVTASELEYLPVLQHARPVAARAFLDLLHRQFDFPGLQVRDPDLRIEVELGQFFSEHRRAQVLRDLGQLALLVRKRSLHDQDLQIADPVDDGPEFVV